MSFLNYRMRYLLAISACLLLVTQVYAKKAQGKPVPSLAKTHFDSVSNQQDLPSEIKTLLKKYKISKNNLSIYVRDLNSSTALLEHNPDTLRSPASTMKLLTTYSSLKELGPNYSWRTEVWLRGELKEGILDGDLLLKGYGDPFLVYENFWKLIKTLRDKGLKEIHGDVIIDNSYFNLQEHDPSAFDGKPYRVYNAPSSALMFNFQATRFLFKPIVGKKIKGKKDGVGKVEITPLPLIKGFNFVNKVKLVKGRCRNSHTRPKFSKNEQGQLVIKGKYAIKCKQRFVLRAVSTPEEHVFNAFRDFWVDLKGVLLGELKIGRIKKGDERFHVYSSPTLGEQIRLINKWSNNVMTKQLLLTLGAKKYGAPATQEKGRRAVLDVMLENGIDTTGVNLESGSGLSRNAKVSARQMGSLLETAYRDAYMPEFMASLSLPGIDGTLVNRFRKEDLRGRSHFKTGTLNFVSAISGYMLNRNGKRLVIVIQHNGKKTGGGRAKKIQDALLRWSFEQ